MVLNTCRLFVNPVVAAEEDPGAKAIYRHARAIVRWRSVIAFGDPEDLPGKPDDWVEISRDELERLASEAMQNGGRE